MKKSFLLPVVVLLAAILALSSCKNGGTEATIKGKVSNIGGVPTISLVKLDFSSLVTSTIYSLDPAPDGSFKITVPLTEPGIFMIVPGKDIAGDVRLEIGVLMSPEYNAVPYYAGKVKLLVMPGKTCNVDIDFKLGGMGSKTAFPQVTVNSGFKKDQAFFQGMTDKLNQQGFFRLLFEQKDSMIPKQLTEAEAANLVGAFQKKMTDSVETTKGLSTFVRDYFKTEINCQAKNALILFYNTAFKGSTDAFYQSGTPLPAYARLFEPADTLASKWSRSFNVFLENRANHYTALEKKSSFKFYTLSADKYIAVKAHIEMPLSKFYLATQIKHIQFSEYDKPVYDKLQEAFKTDFPKDAGLIK